MDTKSDSKYPCSRASDEATTSIRPVSHHLHYAVLTMRTFWPLFSAIIVSPQWAVFGEIRLALNWELIHSFTKELRMSVLPHYRRTLPAPLSTPVAETLCARRLSRHLLQLSCGFEVASKAMRVYIGTGVVRNVPKFLFKVHGRIVPIFLNKVHGRKYLPA